MTRDPVKEIANAVLYEGYVLYPYRPTALKNQERWTFGGVFPRSFSSQSGSDPWAMQTECLVQGDGAARLNVQIRFLHLVERRVLQFDPAAVGEAAAWRAVGSLEVDGQPFAAWEEAIEREVDVPGITLAALGDGPARFAFGFDGSEAREVLSDASGGTAGALVRVRRPLEGAVAVSASGVAPGLYRLTVRVENITPLAQADCERRALAQRSAFASTHAILRLAGAQFISLIDPPDALAAEARACVNEGCWPVLAGPEGAQDTVLASPIILYDYPQVAPESPGDLFDGAEIDEILTLRILTLTDAEKREAAAAEPKVRALLERTEALTANDLARLHGALRSPRQFPKPALACDLGGDLRVGARVLLKPKPGGDIMDIALAGKVAIVEAIERDFEDRVHVAVTIEDDPGRDLGLGRFPGHRFFFSREEMEPIGAETAP
ncbi:MAG TPA: hypothetical protein VHW60_08305 [Caulobacteraceae bacterium]|jgi:hydrogenase maturation protease|nr:hypothetical protein [Caulobacteraceae bacterium]